MKIFQVLAFAFFLMMASFSFGQSRVEPWTASQIMEPSLLAWQIKNPSKGLPLIINIGPDATIKGSVDIGPASEKENIDKLKSLLAKQKKTKEIVIYCGCCPFEKCSNIRPAFELLNKMGFKNQKVLGIKKNIKVNWIDMNYPVN
ncbi:MAG: rhodanese-like domain-containing protein [Flavobacterium sp.]|uniref:rhodanese-like domain-containing protein n=1 Tax=Flavobacterium sp. TaxID=239 RepID=UPI001B067DA7|nr:rhodanese-like domain-containing protein [Flavobacterium sp.]MBO9584790.1 rhodanese-like domain-containing protein [Flavobacterium sp.]